MVIGKAHDSGFYCGNEIELCVIFSAIPLLSIELVLSCVCINMCLFVFFQNMFYY